MELVLLTVLIAAEIVLSVLTLKKGDDKSLWMKNRTILKAAELLLIVIVVILPIVNLKWRYAFALTLLGIRFVFGLIIWLIRRKKTVGKIIKARAVVSCVMSVITFAFMLVPAFVFTDYDGLPTTGEYTVGQTAAILVDSERKDPFETDGSMREVPVHFYYPENVSEELPLIIFSHGAFGYYQSNFSTYVELASNGYVVAALDHPHHSFFTSDTDGNTIIVDQTFINDVMRVSNSEEPDQEKVNELTQSWLKLRVDDEKFVLDTIEEAKLNNTIGNAWHCDNSNDIQNVVSIINIDKIGIMGHSLGGATAAKMGRERDDVDTVIVLDGTMFGEIKEVKDGKRVYYSEPYPIPIMDCTKEQDYIAREDYEKEYGVPYVNAYALENAKEGKTVLFTNAEHMDFTDLPLISPILGSMLGHGTVDTKEMMTTVNGLVLNWFDYYLKNEGTLNIQEKY